MVVKETDAIIPTYVYIHLSIDKLPYIISYIWSYRHTISTKLITLSDD